MKVHFSRTLITTALCAGLGLCMGIAFWLGHNVGREPLEVTVSGLSMSPTLCCSSLQTTCSQCKYEFRVAAENPDGSPLSVTSNSIQCPLCGHRIESARANLIPGDSVEITPFDVGPDGLPQINRFDIVAVGKHEAEPPAIKRVIGLPHERIEIKRGDIYRNDQLLRKTLEQFFATAITVADSRFRVAGMPWTIVRPTDQDSFVKSWRFTDGSWELNASPSTGQHTLSFEVPHVFPGPELPKSGITDYNGFDQFSSRVLNQVFDIAVSLNVSAHEESQLSISIDDGIQTWTMHLSFEGIASVVRGQSTIWKDKEVVRYDQEKPTAIDFACFDQQIILAIDGKEVFSQPFERLESERRYPTSPCAIHGSGGTITISSLTICRDLYYLASSLDANRASSKWSLEADEYFVLGDYSPLSIDSRSSKFGSVKVSDLLGKVKLSCP